MPLTGGGISLEGGDPELPVCEQAHYLGHQDAVKPALSVQENLDFWSRFLGDAAIAVDAALAAVGLDGISHLPAGYLSAGQRRRLSIARLIAVPRPIWLLDEPTSALDAAAQATLADADGAAPRRRRHDSRRHPRPDRLGRSPRTSARPPCSFGPFRPGGGGLGWYCVPARPSAGRKRMTALSALLLRDMRLAVRVGGGALIGVLFFLIVVTLMPFAIGPDLALLARIGPAILWLGALLASLLALDRLVAADYEDGSLDLILMARVPLELAVAVKAIAHWLTTGLPLVIAAPLLGLLLNLDPKATGAVALTLLVGTPALTFIGLIGAALSVALRRGGLLLAVLVLPLTIPVLIFGVAASNAAIVGPVPFGTPFTLLSALTLMSAVLGPFAAAAALRHGLE